MIHDRLCRIVIVSTAVHAAVLSGWSNLPLPAEYRPIAGAPLTLLLQSPSQAASTTDSLRPTRTAGAPAAGSPRTRIPEAEAAPGVRSHTRPLPEPDPISTISQRERQQDRAPEAKSVPERSESDAPIAEPMQAAAARSDAASVSTTPQPLSAGQVRDRLRDAVETYFYYPPLARRRGWEGEVVVGIRVEGDGRLSTVDVVSSSGYRVLDAAAIDSIRRMARLQMNSVDWLPEGGVEVEMPVLYRLIDAPA